MAITRWIAPVPEVVANVAALRVDALGRPDELCSDELDDPRSSRARLTYLVEHCAPARHGGSEQLRWHVGKLSFDHDPQARPGAIVARVMELRPSQVYDRPGQTGGAK
jgi:hypothetical protein